MTSPGIHRFLSIGFVSVACTTPNPNYRPPGTGSDAGTDDAAVGCRNSADCGAPNGVCDLSVGASAGRCVQCTSTEPAACTGDKPLCGVDNTCRGCAAHSECASAVCRPDGACSSGDDVAYVNPNGAGAECTKSEPCASLQTAVAARRPYIKITGALAGPTVIKATRVILLADPGATLSNAGPILTIEGNSNVVIYDLQFTGPGFGIVVQAKSVSDVSDVSLFRCALTNAGINVGAASTLSVSQSTIYNANSFDCAIDTYGDLNITKSTISDNANGICGAYGRTNISETIIANNTEAGIKVNNGQLNVRQSTISGNGAFGISSRTSTANISQSTISNNGYGISADGSMNISNNFIVHNGPSSSDYGGVFLLHTFGSGSFQFNTVADNQAGGINSQSGGVHCVGNVTVSHNLVIRNTGGDANPPTSGTCGSRSSLFAEPNPGFADASKNDYHLTSVTPGTIVDAASCLAEITVDKDGDPRAPGGRCDLGADEYSSK